MNILKDKWFCSHGHNGLEHPACWLRWKRDNGHLKVGFLDIETSQLDADFGFMYSWAIKEGGYRGVVHKDSISHRNAQNKSLEPDREIVKSLIREMRHYDILVTYYGSRFDIPFVRSRALEMNLDFPVQNEIRHLDLYWIARNKLKLSSNKLASVCEYFEIVGKTPLTRKIWRLAATGDKRALEYIVIHNIHDVVILEKVYNKLLPYIKMTRRSI